MKLLWFILLLFLIILLFQAYNSSAGRSENITCPPPSPEGSTSPVGSFSVPNP